METTYLLWLCCSLFIAVQSFPLSTSEFDKGFTENGVTSEISDNIIKTHDYSKRSLDYFGSDSSSSVSERFNFLHSEAASTSHPNLDFSKNLETSDISYDNFDSDSYSETVRMFSDSSNTRYNSKPIGVKPSSISSLEIIVGSKDSASPPGRSVPSSSQSRYSSENPESSKSSSQSSGVYLNYETSDSIYLMESSTSSSETIVSSGDSSSPPQSVPSYQSWYPSKTRESSESSSQNAGLDFYSETSDSIYLMESSTSSSETIVSSGDSHSPSESVPSYQSWYNSKSPESSESSSQSAGVDFYYETVRIFSESYKTHHSSNSIDLMKSSTSSSEIIVSLEDSSSPPERIPSYQSRYSSETPETTESFSESFDPKSSRENLGQFSDSSNTRYNSEPIRVTESSISSSEIIVGLKDSASLPESVPSSQSRYSSENPESSKRSSQSSDVDFYSETADSIYLIVSSTSSPETIVSSGDSYSSPESVFSYKSRYPSKTPETSESFNESFDQKSSRENLRQFSDSSNTRYNSEPIRVIESSISSSGIIVGSKDSASPPGSVPSQSRYSSENQESSKSSSQSSDVDFYSEASDSIYTKESSTSSSEIIVSSENSASPPESVPVPSYQSRYPVKSLEFSESSSQSAGLDVYYETVRIFSESYNTHHTSDFINLMESSTSSSEIIVSSGDSAFPPENLPSYHSRYFSETPESSNSIVPS